MTRRILATDALILASHNRGKLSEIRPLLGDRVKQLCSAADLSLQEPVEDGQSFFDNALIKAQFVAKASNMIALSDDSGIVIPALNGDPGIYSADWMKAAGSPDALFTKLEGLLEGKSKSAYFECCMVVCWPDGHYETTTGRIHGTISFPARGTHGHGYDPIFIPKDDTRTFAEISLLEKNQISHRALALKAMIETYFA